MPQHKIYKLECSPLYKLRSKRKLCTLLKTELLTLKKLLKTDNYWITNQVNSKTSKIRRIYAPKPQIKKIQKRLQILLSRIYLPTYLFSGKKGTCYVDNAKYHQRAKHVLTLDISAFYKMTEDVAWLLSDIVSYEDFLPTGSPASQIIAFFAYRLTFNRLNDLAKRNSAKFSLFVDDMTFSSMKPFTKKFPFIVSQELKKVGLQINPKKTQRFSSNEHKLITGCIITPKNDLRVRNKQRKEILTEWFNLHAQKEKDYYKVKSLLGKIQSSKQIEENLFEDKYRYLFVLDKHLQ